MDTFHHISTVKQMVNYNKIILQNVGKDMLTNRNKIRDDNIIVCCILVP